MSLPRTGARWFPRRLPRPAERSRAAWISAAIPLLALLLYRGTLDAGFTHWDDDVYVTRNPDVHELSLSSVLRAFGGFSNCNYHPLTYLTWMVEFQIVGLSPWLYHLDNVVLHAGASVLAFFLSRRLLGSDAAGALVALLFLVHPLRVESVAWVAERKDVLCAFFFLAGLMAYLKFLEKESAGKYAAAVLLCLAALLSKAMAVTFPAVQALFLIYRRQWSRKQLLLLGPFAALSVVFAVLAYLAQKAFGAIRDTHGESVLAHALTVPKALAMYAGKLVVPHPLSPRYLHGAAEGFSDPHALCGLLLAAAGVAALWVSFRRRRVALLGLGFFAATWAPVSGIVPMSTVIADRYMYLPALGLLWPLCQSVVEGLRGAVPGPRRAAAAGGLAALLILAAAWGGLTQRRVHAWRDGVTLWRDALRENPENPYAYNQLAVEYLAGGRYGEAAAASIESIRLGLRQPRYLFNLCLAYRGLGKGEKELDTARGILAGAPHFLPARTVELRHLREAGRLDRCERLLERLLEKFPGDPALLAARGDLRLERGEPREALEEYLRALKARPNDREVLLAASLAVARLGDAERASRLAKRALLLPGSVLSPWELERLEEVRASLARLGGPGP